MSRRVVAAFLWSALFCWVAGILWLSSLTPQQLPEAAFIAWDKLNHFLAFALGGWLAASALRASRAEGRAAPLLLAAVALIAAFGAFDEGLQKFTPGRTGGDLYDWIADFLGALSGALLSLVTHDFIVRPRTRP